VAVEVWEGEGVDYGFLEFFDDGVEAADVYTLLERLGRDDAG